MKIALLLVTFMTLGGSSLALQCYSCEVVSGEDATTPNECRMNVDEVEECADGISECYSRFECELTPKGACLKRTFSRGCVPEDKDCDTELTNTGGKYDLQCCGEDRCNTIGTTQVATSE
ncbi:uncharacterized protein LOC135156902 [Lytechinus pictus]|uniref:uncharacterized protein LOC135156902 n=1 Tax=Lytechinus pictus TaxID=7653 RepID=UPI0030B9F766